MSQARESAETALAAGKRDEAIDIAQSAADRGDAGAATLIAIWRLIGDPLPRDLREARRLLALAADQGMEEAALLEIPLIANGAGAPPDWPLACARLKKAAAAHGGKAAADLALIDAMAIDSSGAPQSMPPAERLNDRPAIVRWRGFLSPQECAHIALSTQDILGPSMVADPSNGRLIANPVRRSSEAQIGPTRESLPIQAILKRIAAATNTDVRQGEPLTVLHYAPGQEYRPHLDALPHVENQRVATVILYLNEGYVGGETHFLAPDQAVAGRAGDAICFINVLPDQTPDPAARHAGLPVQQGAKWAATRWIRARPFDVWASPQ